MATSYSLILLLTLCCYSNTVFAEEYEDLEGVTSRISKILKDGAEIMNPQDQNGKALSYPGCGFRTPMIQVNSTQSGGSRGGGFEEMVGGNEAEHTWPWMVAIYDGTKEEDWNITKLFLCGASLISRKYALATAHCFVGEGGIMDTDLSKKFVVVGGLNLTDGTKYPVSRILIHPDFSQVTQHNDIALIEFEIPIELSKIVYPVCLPSTGLTDKIEANRSEVVATVWGYTEEGYDTNHVLMEIRLFPMPLEECKVFFKDVIKKQFCTGDTNKDTGESPCMVHSDGPLVYKLEDNSYVQVGIVSYVSSCIRPGSPTVFARVSEYTKWIYDNSDLGK